MTAEKPIDENFGILKSESHNIMAHPDPFTHLRLPFSRLSQLGIKYDPSHALQKAYQGHLQDTNIGAQDIKRRLAQIDEEASISLENIDVTDLETAKEKLINIIAHYPRRYVKGQPLLYDFVGRLEQSIQQHRKKQITDEDLIEIIEIFRVEFFEQHAIDIGESRKIFSGLLDGLSDFIPEPLSPRDFWQKNPAETQQLAICAYHQRYHKIQVQEIKLLQKSQVQKILQDEIDRIKTPTSYFGKFKKIILKDGSAKVEALSKLQENCNVKDQKKAIKTIIEEWKITNYAIIAAQRGLFKRKKTHSETTIETLTSQYGECRF